MKATSKEEGPVRFAASVLRDTLRSKLPGASASSSPTHDSILRAIKLVERFILSCNECPNAFDLLKNDIKRALLAQPAPPKLRRASASQSTTRDAEPEAAAAPSTSQHTSRPSSKGTDVSWTLPPTLLARKARTKATPYGLMVLAEDANARNDEHKEKRTRALNSAKAREMLDRQMDELRARQQQEQREKEREAAELVALKKQLVAEEEAKYLAGLKMVEQTRKIFKEQVEEKEMERDQQHQRAMREAHMERARHAEEKRAMQAEQERKRLEAAQKYRLAQQRQQEELQAKALALERQQQEERAYNAKCMRIADEKEAARLAQLEAIKARQRAMFERGGGVALQKGLEEAAREAAEKSSREAAAYEARMKQQEADREARRQQRERHTLQVLDSQMADKAAAKRAEVQEARRLAAEADAVVAAVKSEKASAKASHKQAAQQRLADLKRAVVLEAKKRYAEFSETMGEQEMQHHGKVLAGQIRGFTVTDPIGVKAGPRSNKH